VSRPKRRAEPSGGIPENIAGLDTQDGLRRVLGNEALYLVLLQKFVNGQKKLVAELAAALACGDLETAQRLAHTIKGVAGSIGAAQVQALAAEVERLVRERGSGAEIEAAFAAFAAPLGQLIAAIESSLPRPEQRVDVIVDAERLRAVCAKLEALLDYDDSAAIDVFDENADLLNSAFPGYYRRIDKSIKEFDFEEALAALREATLPSR
jgi:two-component system sensor histidine kinase/response regulator